MTQTMTDTGPALALPAGGSTRRRHVLTVGIGLAGVASVMTFASLAAAYLAVRALSHPWPPPKVSLDNYLGTTMSITLIMSAITVEWGVQALRQGNRRQAVSGLVLTPLFGLAFLNLLWYLVSKLGFGPASHPYGTLVYAFVVVIVVDVALGIGFLLITLMRIAGNQVTAADPAVARAAGWFWHTVVLAWLVAFMALYVFQHR
jgi:cytochrome o ubiquinol oxidase subunit 3